MCLCDVGKVESTFIACKPLFHFEDKINDVLQNQFKLYLFDRIDFSDEILLLRDKVLEGKSCKEG